MAKSSTTGAAALKGYVIGRSGFAKISAVEGLTLSDRARQLFDSFDRQSIHDVERRVVISMQHSAAANRHVVPKNGAWAVCAGRSASTSGTFATRQAAIDHAAEVAATSGGTVILHGADGRIRSLRR